MLVTLTYKGTATIEQAKKDVKALVKKIRNLKVEREIDYLGIFEMQKNGNVHCHLFLKGVFLLNEIVQELWKKGRTYTQQIDNIEIVASYLSKKESKENIKNGTRLYIHSQNVTKPPVEKAIYENARAEAEENNCKLVSEYTTLVVDTKTNKIANKIKIERYKKQKNNKKGQVAQC